MEKISKHTLIVVSAIAVLLLMNGCASPSKYRVPDLNLPDHYRGSDSLQIATDSMTSASISWKEFFGDAQLDSLIEKGIKNNFDMMQSLKAIEISSRRLSQAKLEWLPSLEMNVGSANHQFRSQNYYSSPSSKWYDEAGETPPDNMYRQSIQNSSGLSLNWEIDIWGKIKNQKAAAVADYLQTQEARKAVQTELISKISESYYTLLLLNAQLEVSQTNYDLTQNTYRFVELQYQAGKTTALAKQQTRSQMLIAKAMIPNLQQQIAIQENTLYFLLGEVPNELDLGDMKFSEIVQNDTLQTGVPIQMVSLRPDVRSAELELQIKNAAVGVAQVNRYPNLEINLTGGVNSMLAKNWFDIPGSLFGGLIGTVTQPIFNKKKLKTDFQVAKLERENAEINLQKTVYNAITEVSDALVTLQKLEEGLEIAQEQVETAQLAIRQSNMLFNSGYATYLEIINAQKVALESDLNYNTLKYNKLLARIQLYKALGGGWQ